MSKAISRKKLIIIIVAIVCVLAIIGSTLAYVFLGRGGIAEIYANAENTYKKTYHSFCTLEHDPDITIDGKLDEQYWQGKAWYTSAFPNDTSGTMPTMRTTGFMTDYGVYIACEVKDTNLCGNDQRATSNTFLELNLFAENVGENRPVDALYNFSASIDLRADDYSENPNIDRAVALEGEVNSGDTKGAVFEVFVDWKDLGIDVSKGTPELFYMLPVYHPRLQGTGAPTISTQSFYNRKAPKDWYRFDKNGYMTPDREGAVLGDNCFGFAKSGNWDISGEAGGVVRSRYGTDTHIIFFKEAYGSNFIVETDIIPIGTLGDPYPTAGIMFLQNDKANDNTFYRVQMSLPESNLTEGIAGTKTFKNYFVSTVNNQGAWNQTTLQNTTGMKNSGIKTRQGVRLTVVKYGDKFIYFANGEFLAEESKPFMDAEVTPGLFTSAGDVIFKNYSCKEIDENGLKDFLNKKGFYLVDAKAQGSQGTVTASSVAVQKGGSYTLTISSKSKYEISSLLINDKERLGDFKAKGMQGEYTVSNINDNQKIRVSFKQVENPVKFQGKVLYGEQGVSATLKLTSTTNNALRYDINTTGDGSFNVELPKGTYRLALTSGSYQAIIENINLAKDTTKNYQVKQTSFPQSVTVNGKTLKSNRDKWNMVPEFEGRIETSYARGAKQKPVWFAKTGVDFAVEVTAKYTTNFKPGVEYQPDLMAGFMFNDGSSDGWIVVRNQGFVTPTWNVINNVFPYSVLWYPTKTPVKFGLVKKGATVYLYIDSRMVMTMEWSKIAANIKPDSEVAIGLIMLADKTSDIELSNWKLEVGTAAANKYMQAGSGPDKPLANGSIFASSVTVNGIQLQSDTGRWNVKQQANRVITASHAMGNNLTPLYFNKTGSTAMMKTKIEYTTNFKKDGDYQINLMGGFYFSDGKNTGYVLADRHGICITNDKHIEHLVDYFVLDNRYGCTPVDFSVVLKDDYIYAYFNDTLIYRIKTSKVIPGVQPGAKLAFGIAMKAEHDCDIRMSNITITTTPAEVNSYMAAHNAGQQEVVPLSIRGYIDYARQLGQGLEVDQNKKVVRTVPLNNNTTVFIGDSFFDRREFWHNFYTESFKGKNVFCAGIGGSRADQWLLMLDEVFAGFKGTAPKNIVINLGTNDLATGYAASTVAENLEELIAELHNRFPNTGIYYFGVTQRRVNASSHYGGCEAKTNENNRLIKEWCGGQSYAHYIDSPITTDMLRDDGLHPKLEAYSNYVNALNSAGCKIS